MKNMFIFSLLFLWTHLSAWSQELKTINISCLGGPSVISMAKLFKEKPLLDQKIKTNYHLEKSPDLLAAKMISGKADIAVIPTTLGVKLYNKGIHFKLAGTSLWGGLYMASDLKIKSWKDLKGKEIYTIGRGLTPDILLKFILKKKGINPDKDVTLKYLTNPQELTSMILIGRAKVVLIPGTIYSIVNLRIKNFKINFDIQKEWNKLTGEKGLPQTSLFVSQEIVKNHSKFLNSFINEYKKSILWVQSQPYEAGSFLETLKIGLTAKTVQNAIPLINLKFIEATKVKSSLNKYLNILNGLSSESLAGKIPDDDFYYKR